MPDLAPKEAEWPVLSPLEELKAWANGGAQRQREEALAILLAPGPVAEAFSAWRRGQGHRRVWLAGVDLRGRDLRGVDFRHAVLSDADLSGARLAGALWEGAVLDRVRHQGATFDEADPLALPPELEALDERQAEVSTLAKLRDDQAFRAFSLRFRQRQLRWFRRSQARFSFEFTNYLNVPCTLALSVADGYGAKGHGELFLRANGLAVWDLHLKPKEHHPKAKLSLVVHLRLDGKDLPVGQVRIAGWAAGP